MLQRNGVRIRTVREVRCRTRIARIVQQIGLRLKTIPCNLSSPDLGHPVGSLTPSAHLLGKLPASPLSTHRDPWHVRNGFVPAWPPNDQRVLLHCGSATNRTGTLRGDATWKPNRRW